MLLKFFFVTIFVIHITFNQFQFIIYYSIPIIGEQNMEVDDKQLIINFKYALK